MPLELRCTATNAAGKPCGTPSRLVDPETLLCPSHDPDRREDILRAARKGGQATANRFKRRGLAEEELPPLKSPQDAAERLDLIGRAVATGCLGHAEGRTVATATREWLKAFETGVMADEMKQLAEEIERVRALRVVN